MSTSSIEQRYSGLAGSGCCRSCGGAVNYAGAGRGEVCVDLGCGGGTDALLLAEAVGAEGFVYGIDIADGMIDKAKTNAGTRGVTNVSFIKSNLEEIPLVSSSVDLVISTRAVNHAGDKQKVWGEIHRVLRRGGRFVVSDICAEQPVPDEFRNSLEAVAEGWAGAVTRAEFLRIVDNAGFASVEMLEESQPYEEGKISVRSFTVAGRKRCCC